jgi:uncharacterized lipoprotein
MIRILGLALVVLLSSGCASSYKKQAYSKQRMQKDFEEEYNLVWKASLKALEEYKLTEKEIDSGKIETDWIYSTSNDKYVEYKVNGFPRKKYLRVRYKLVLSIEKLTEKVSIAVDSKEEIEELKSDGSFDSWDSVSDIDTARASALLKDIELKILSLSGT